MVIAMIMNGNETVNAIILDNKFIKEIYSGNTSVYKQTLSELKLGFLDGFKLNQLDTVYIGKI